MLKTLLIGVLVVALALALGACGSADEKVAEGIAGEAIGGDVEVDEDSVTITTDDGEATIAGAEGALAEGFPEDFPIYDDATVKASTVFKGDGQAQYSAVLSTSDSVTDVYDWYKAELPSSGWTIENDAQISTGDGESAILSAKRDGMEASTAIGPEDGGTAIVITLVTSD